MEALRSKRCRGVGPAQSLVHAQITPRSLKGKASNACFFVFPANVAHARACVRMHPHDEDKGMSSLRQSILQRQ